MFREITYLIKVTDKCNIKCDYCFTRLESNLMPLETIVRLLDMSKGYQRVKFVMMGGEPLMAGYEWFESVKEIIDAHVLKTKQYVDMDLCTNGILLKDKHIPLFNNVFISYDGIGNGVKGTNKIREKVSKYGKAVFVTVSKHNYQKLQQIYEELESLGVRRMLMNFDVYASKYELMMFKNAVDSIQYKRGKTRIAMIDNIKKLNTDGHYGNLDDISLGRPQIGSTFAVECDGTLSTSIMVGSPTFGNVEDYDHIIDVIGSCKFISVCKEYINSITNDLIPCSFNDNYHRGDVLKSIMNGRENVI